MLIDDIMEILQHARAATPQEQLERLNANIERHDLQALAGLILMDRFNTLDPALLADEQKLEYIRVMSDILRTQTAFARTHDTHAH
ncbi:hypothetical protein [Coralliovum pocilloporae]|uniref:hypothetical protein n=1 Tax=Coralliovum pocilloporae TaxID=3066369 RepID=UPI0033073A68